ncbi:MAG: hypothetical protein ACRDN0_38285, partial [Trebonia sp.]
MRPSAEKIRSWIIRVGTGAGAALKSTLKAGTWRDQGWKDLGWRLRAGIGAAAVVVLAGFGLALVALLGRPAVSVSSGESLVQVRLDGVGTQVTAIRATSAGRPLALTRQGTSFAPATAVPQGRTVDVRVTAAPPSWLHWLLGSGVSTSAT